ncbi:hypothetical protein LCGC14_0474320 [marine sediment metagenome]|uniref:Uncharacterized protein n=1 Tax=marine sediment metagenome TaxID=412755 RepID=A0A0F9SU36_9ZZZZ
MDRRQMLKTAGLGCLGFLSVGVVSETFQSGLASLSILRGYNPLTQEGKLTLSITWSDGQKFVQEVLVTDLPSGADDNPAWAAGKTLLLIEAIRKRG